MSFFRVIVSRFYDVTLLAGAIVKAVSPLWPSEVKRRLSWLTQRISNPKLHSRGNGYLVHGVSAGEVKVAVGLVHYLSSADPYNEYFISSSTESGFMAASRALGQDGAFVMPLDMASRMNSLFLEIKPAIIVLVESELWPQLLYTAKIHNVPVVVVSARISDRTFARLSNIPIATSRLLSLVTHFFAQDNDTLCRLQKLGVDSERITVSGNFKLAPPIYKETEKVGSGPSHENQVMVFGNIHPAELDIVYSVADQLIHEFPKLCIYFIPRHPEKFTREMIQKTFSGRVRFGNGPVHDWKSLKGITWINSMGVLSEAYGNAQIAVVGGTFCEVGGHDLVEPLHKGAISVYGPNIRCQRSLHEELCYAPYAFQAESAAKLVEILSTLLRSPEMISRLSRAAVSDFTQYRRATEEMVKRIVALANGSGTYAP